MKRISSIICMAMVMLTLTLTGCGNDAKSKLREEINAANRQCPINLGAMGMLTEFTYDESDNVAAMTYLINEEIFPISSCKNRENSMRGYLSSYFQSTSARDMLDMLIEADASYRIIYKGDSSGDEYTLTFSPEELVEIANSSSGDEYGNQRRQLEAMTESENAMCPIMIDDVTEFTSAVLGDRYLDYNYTIKSEVFSVTDDIVSQLKEANIEALRNLWSGATGEHVISLFVNLGIGVRYNYIHEATGEKVTVTITPEEIGSLSSARQIINNINK